AAKSRRLAVPLRRRQVSVRKIRSGHSPAPPTARAGFGTFRYPRPVGPSIERARSAAHGARGAPRGRGKDSSIHTARLRGNLVVQFNFYSYLILLFVAVTI